MGRTGEGEGAPSSSVPDSECCMCGDCGLSSELFTCKHCRFRSQHKYCSNLYPGAESYNICNWCLSQLEDVNKTREGSTKTSPNSSQITTDDNHQDEIKMNKRKSLQLGDNHGGRLKDMIKKTSIGDQIKRHKKFPADGSAPSSAGRKRVTSGSGNIAKRIITRAMSEEISNGRGMIIKQVFRNKVRRYKLLDEVSS